MMKMLFLKIPEKKCLLICKFIKKIMKLHCIFNFLKSKIKKITSFIVSQIKNQGNVFSLFLIKTKRNLDHACGARQ